MILIIGLFYPSLHSNLMNPPIKAFLFSLLAFFWSLLKVSGYPKERERRSRPKEEHILMLNLVVEKGASKDNDRSGLTIIRPRTGTPVGFVQRPRFDFGLGTSPYRVDICFLFHSRPRCALIHCYHHLVSHFPSYYLNFHLYSSNYLISFLISILILRETKNYLSYSPLSLSPLSLSHSLILTSHTHLHVLHSNSHIFLCPHLSFKNITTLL